MTWAKEMLPAAQALATSVLQRRQVAVAAFPTGHPFHGIVYSSPEHDICEAPSYFFSPNVWFVRGLLSLGQLHEEYPALTHNATLEAQLLPVANGTQSSPHPHLILTSSSLPPHLILTSSSQSSPHPHLILTSSSPHSHLIRTSFTSSSQSSPHPHLISSQRGARTSAWRPTTPLCAAAKGTGRCSSCIPSSAQRTQRRSRRTRILKSQNPSKEVFQKQSVVACEKVRTGVLIDDGSCLQGMRRVVSPGLPASSQ